VYYISRYYISSIPQKAGDSDGQIQKARKSAYHRLYGRGRSDASFVYPPPFLINVSRLLITINNE
jgi:hypothetical protein